MDNQTSSPQIIFPNVPDDFCPSGNWTEVLQTFIDEVLANGTINVPGLGDVTPQEIQDINDELASLQNQIDALEQVQIRQGVVTGLAINDSTGTVTFTTPMPTANYTVAFTPRLSANTASALPTFLIKTGSKTANQFEYLCENNGSPAVISEVEWVAIHSA
jgi:hypothetical protein